MTHIVALFRRLTESLSSPQADELHEAVLAGDKPHALSIIRRQGFSSADSLALLQLCSERWGGVDVELTEVPLEGVMAAIALHELRSGASGGEASPYLVRHGRYLMPARAMRQGSSYELWTASGVVPLERVRQFWLVGPKPAAAAGDSPAPPLSGPPAGPAPQ